MPPELDLRLRRYIHVYDHKRLESICAGLTVLNKRPVVNTPILWTNGQSKMSASKYELEM